MKPIINEITLKPLIFASSNTHKLEEVRRIFKLYTVLGLKDIGFTKEIVEDGFDLEDNAFIKARAVAEYVKEKNLDCAVLSDDSGLFVKALNYEPGMYSSRYSGLGDEGNRQKLLNNLINIQDRSAYFQCYAVLIMPDGTEMVEQGKTYGDITKTKIGDESFGYDCIFWSNPLKKTFGQATTAEKDSVSHRAIAMKPIKEYLDSINYRGVDTREY